MSADILDNASEIESAEREYMIQKARNSKPKRESTGFCWYCNDVVDNEKIYCSPECRDDHELEQASQRRHKGRY